MEKQADNHRAQKLRQEAVPVRDDLNQRVTKACNEAADDDTLADLSKSIVVAPAQEPHLDKDKENLDEQVEAARRIVVDEKVTRDRGVAQFSLELAVYGEIVSVFTVVGILYAMFVMLIVVVLQAPVWLVDHWDDEYVEEDAEYLERHQDLIGFRLVV